MDKKIEKIIYKCLILMEKGHSLDECISRFKGHRDEIKEYFKTIENIKSLEVIMPEKDFCENSLAQIMGEAKRREIIFSEKADAAATIKRSRPGTKKRLLLRPAMIFLVFLILSVFSFSGTLFASQETVPGQVLYPLKKSFEGFKLIIYPESQKDDLHFQFLNNRIDEANTLLESEGSDVDILVNDLIIEIDMEYQMCKQFNCFPTRDEDQILNSINTIKSRHRNRMGMDQDNATINGHDKNEGPGHNNNSGMGQMGNNEGSSQNMGR